MKQGIKVYYENKKYCYLCNKYRKYIEEHVLPLYKEEERAHNQIIAFDFLRLLFPIIDTFNPLYKKAHRLKCKNNTESRSILLKKLKVKHPYLIWDLYRNAITHNDYFDLVIYRKSLIIPHWLMEKDNAAYFDEYEKTTGIRDYLLGDTRIGINATITLHLNPYSLARNFMSFLENESVSHSNVVVNRANATKIFSKQAKKGKKKGGKVYNIDIINDIEDILKELE